MPIQNVAFPLEFIQPLETRRLLSLTPIGAEVTVPFPTEGNDVATVDDEDDVLAVETIT